MNHGCLGFQSHYLTSLFPCVPLYHLLVFSLYFCLGRIPLCGFISLPSPPSNRSLIWSFSYCYCLTFILILHSSFAYMMFSGGHPIIRRSTIHPIFHLPYSLSPSSRKTLINTCIQTTKWANGEWWTVNTQRDNGQRPTTVLRAREIGKKTEAPKDINEMLFILTLTKCYVQCEFIIFLRFTASSIWWSGGGHGHSGRRHRSHKTIVVLAV